MAILVHRYDAPDRFVAGTVGQPGERAFFLQAREGNRITSVACEKQQVSVLAEHLDRVLDEVLRRSPAGSTFRRPPPGPRHRSAGRADHRGVPGRHDDHRLGSEHRPDRHRAVLQRRCRGRDRGGGDQPAAAAEEPDEIDADEVFVVKITASYARDFVARAQALVAAGRPSCPFCLQPIDPHGHICPRANGYRRPLFD